MAILLYISQYWFLKSKWEAPSNFDFEKKGLELRLNDRISIVKYNSLTDYLRYWVPVQRIVRKCYTEMSAVATADIGNVFFDG